MVSYEKGKAPIPPHPFKKKAGNLHLSCKLSHLMLQLVISIPLLRKAEMTPLTSVEGKRMAFTSMSPRLERTLQS